MSTWHLLALVAALGLFLFDFQNILARWRGRIIEPVSESSDDYTIVLPVYGHPRYFSTRQELLPWQDRILVALNDLPEFADELEAEGWRVARLSVGIPTPPKLMLAALPFITTDYVMRMDADSIPVGDVGCYVTAMAKDGADIASMKIEVKNTTASIWTRYQTVEYHMAMLSRHFRPWLISGAGFLAKRSSLLTILQNHTGNYLGEDVEMGRIALKLKMRIRHLDLVVKTDAPETIVGLFKQRRLWWAGSFRHSIINLDKNIIRTPVWSFYYVLLVWVSLYFKGGVITGLVHPILFAETLLSLFVVYAAVTLIANWQVRSWWMLIFPPYSLVQLIVMPPLGILRYIKLSRIQGQLGRYRV